MKNLIVVEKKVIGEDEVNAVDARGLHEFLEVESAFSDWIKRRITEYDFVNDSDYLKISCRNYTGIGKPPIEYAISIDMAKELSMVERNAKGKEARRYFIECEKRLKSGDQPAAIKKAATRPKIASTLSANIRIAKLLGFSGNQAVLSANRVTKKHEGVDLIEEFGVKLISKNNIQYFTPTELGRHTGGMSPIAANRMLKDMGFQEETRSTKNNLVWKVTDAGKKHCQILDTGKKHSDGTPIQQIKWAAGILQKGDK